MGDGGDGLAPFWRCQALVGFAAAFRPYLTGRAWRDFGVPFEELHEDDHGAWFATIASYLMDGMATGAYAALGSYDERVKWGTEMHPDAATWGMDAATQQAIRMMEGGRSPEAMTGEESPPA